jgi:hypothetical protein
MSNALFHASTGFALGGLVLSVTDEMGPMAFLTAIISVLIDMDALISPDRDHERMFHSSYLPLALVPLCIASAFLPDIGPVPVMAMTAFASHLSLDVLRGEQMPPRDRVLQRLPLQWMERPKMARALELLSLPASLVLIML